MEKKLLKAANKLEKATRKYMEKLVEVDELMRKVSKDSKEKYHLDDYFSNIPPLVKSAVKLDIFANAIKNINKNKNTIKNLDSWDSALGEF